MKPSDYARYPVKRYRKQTKVGDKDLAANEPVAPQVDPTALAPLPDRFVDVGLLLASVKDLPLKIIVALDPAFYDGDRLVLFIDNVEQAPYELQRADVEAGVVNLEIAPEDRTVEKMYSIDYVVRGRFGGDETPRSLKSTFMTDYTAPGDPTLARPQFDREIEADGLTSAKLADMGDVIQGLIPSYQGRADGDTVQAQVVSASGGTVITAPGVQIGPGEANKDLHVEFTRADLVRVGDGVAEFSYWVTDLAGNKSTQSYETEIDLFITSAIEDFVSPTVPLFDDDSLIGEADARSPVYVDIPGNLRLVAGDKIVVSWGNAKLAEVSVVAGDESKPIMFSVPVPYGVVLDEGNGTIPVTYEGFRAGKSLGKPANPTDVVVDLEVPGGPDPDPTDPINQALKPPVLRSAGWNTGDPENEIPVEDSNDPATVIIPWSNALTPPEDAFKVDDVIELLYNGDSFDTYTVDAADVTAGDDIERILPAALIKKYGSGTLPLQYRATRTLASGVENTALSPEQDVVVESASDLPGGGDPLPVGTFDNPHIDMSNTKEHGAPVTIPDYINKKVGDKVRMHFTANWEFNGSGPLITRAEFGAPGDTGETGYPVEKTVGPDDLGNPMAFAIPWLRAQYLYPRALGRFTYTVTTTAGKAVTSPASADILCDTHLNPTPPDDPDRP